LSILTIGSLGKLREGLPEIGIHSFKDWDTIIIPKLEDKLRDGTQDLKSICKDPLKTEKIAAYIVYERPRPSAADLATLTPAADPHGINKMLFQGIWSSLNQAYQKKQDKQDQDKAMVYTLIRSLLSAQLNALLGVDDGFRECPDDDPLMLLDIIKRLISTRADGNEELDRQKALWCVVGGCYTLISVVLIHQCLLGLLVSALSLLCEGRGFEPPHGRGKTTMLTFGCTLL
jgi:hypothetical protein